MSKNANYIFSSLVMSNDINRGEGDAFSFPPCLASPKRLREGEGGNKEHLLSKLFSITQLM